MTAKTAKPIKLCGVDGCRNGWVVASGILVGGRVEHLDARVIPTIGAIEKLNPNIVAIDIPIGLPTAARKGGRIAEKEARKMLVGRASSVFSSPCRRVLQAADYQQALTFSRNSSPDNIGLSKQTWNIVPKIKEVDGFLQANQRWVSQFFEVHPELAFTEMSSFFTGSKFPSKHTTQGLEVRHQALVQNGIDLNLVHHEDGMRKVKLDDYLDAFACLWSAVRIAKGKAMKVPQQVQHDELGLPMQIHW